jgi:hypothetical protein
MEEYHRKKYSDIDQALSYSRSILGVNYFIKPAAKGIYSDTTVARIIIEDSAPSNCPGNSKGE